MPGLRRKPAEEKKTPQQRYAENRWSVLARGRTGAIPGRDAHLDVSGLVTDFCRNQGRWTTVAALADNRPSLHYSTGGGVLILSEYASVAAATRQLLTAVQDRLAAFGAADDGGYPPYGMVRLHLVTPAAGRYADVSDDVFWGRGAHPLKPVVRGVHLLLAEVRGVETSAHRTQN